MRQILSCFSLFVANSHGCHIFLSKKTPKKLETDKIHPTFASETTPTTQQVGMKTRNNNKKKDTIMETTKSSISKKFQSKKDSYVEGFKKAAKLFASSYKAYLRMYSTTFYSAWYGHPYGMR